MRILGLDFGHKKIGVAASDELGIISQGLGFIDNQSWLYAINKIKEIVEEKNIAEIVIGVPLNLKGEIGKKGAISLEFTAFLKENIDIPVNTWDERFSTKAVERVLIKGDVSRKKRKTKIDKLAAQWILQGYLDKHRYEIENEES